MSDGKDNLGIFVQEELNAFVPKITINDGVYQASRRALSMYYQTTFGTLPHAAVAVFPRAVATIGGRALASFIKKHGLTQSSYINIPRYDEMGIPLEGEWSTKDSSVVLTAETSNVGMVVTVYSTSQKLSERICDKLNAAATRAIRGRVIVFRDGLASITEKELAEFPTWDEVSKTIDEMTAARINKLLIPFFDRAATLERLGVSSQLGILFHGSPGTGKTHIIKALARFFHKKATVVILPADLFHHDAAALRQTFHFFRNLGGRLVFVIEDIELLIPSRVGAHGYNPTTQALLEIFSGPTGENKNVILLATTNLLEDIEEAFKRPGRFDEIILVPPPKAEMAERALRTYFEGLPQTIPDQWISYIARKGLSFAQLRYVANELIRTVIFNDDRVPFLPSSVLDEYCRRATEATPVKPSAGFRTAESPTVVDMDLEDLHLAGHIDEIEAVERCLDTPQ